METTVVLTDIQAQAMTCITEDAGAYIQNFASNRGDVAVSNIVQLVIRHCFESNVNVPPTQEAMVAFAFENGLVKTAEQARFEAEAAARAAEQTQGA